MEIVSTAIISAVTAGLTKGVSGIAKESIVDAYDNLKKLLSEKLGSDSKVVHATDDLEEEPQDELLQRVLSKRINQAELYDDTEVRQAAEALLERVEKQPDGKQHIRQVQHAIGSNIAQASGDNSTASVMNSESGK